MQLKTGLGLFGLALAAACGGGGSSNPDAASFDAAKTIDGGGGTSFDNAIDITASIDGSTGTAGTLTTPASSKDFYKATLAAGDKLYIGTATNAQTKNDGSVTDTVVTVYDSSKTAVAQDDDAWPRLSTDSALYFQARAAGTYYVTVEDCNSAFGTGGCYPAASVTDHAYKLFLLHLNKLTGPEVPAGAAQDGTIAHAVTVAYTANGTGQVVPYFPSTIDGTFATAGEKHVFAFTPPNNVQVQSGQRLRAEFFVQPIGAKNGDGSTSNIKAWVTAADGTTIMASVDQKNYKDGDSAPNGPLDISVPVTKGQKYYLFVQSDAAAAAPTTDYYFIEHFVGSFWYGDTEAEGATTMGVNDTYLTAQVLVSPSGVTGGFFADGNIGKAGDVDYYEVDPPAGTKSAELDCSAARRGSGATGITVTLYDGTGLTSLGSAGPESATADLSKTGIAIPANTTKAYLKVAATGQDTANPATYYICDVFYSNM